MPDLTSIAQFRYDHLCPAAEPVHAMRYHWTQDHKPGWCQRDHWCFGLIESGTIILTDHQGQSQELGPGQAWIVPAACPHHVTAAQQDGASEMSLIFRPAFIAHLRPLCDQPGCPPFPWQPGSHLVIPHYPTEAGERLARMVNDLIMHPPGPHNALAALGMILHAQQRWAPSPYADLPTWLRLAMIRLRSRQLLQEGLPALVRLCGRSCDHINRVIRQHRGCTATRLLNDLRLELAAARLRLSADSIQMIAREVGFEDPGHFYRLFKAAHGLTPRHYRAAHATPTGE